MSQAIPYPVKRITAKQAARAGINLAQYPSAGPYPNVTGMRAKFWGRDAAILRVGRYIYHVPPDIYARV